MDRAMIGADLRYQQRNAFGSTIVDGPNFRAQVKGL